MDKNVKELKEQIEAYDSQIAEESQRLMAQTQSQREERQAEIQDAEADLQNAVAHLQDISAQKVALQSQLDAIANEGRAKGQEAEDIRTRLIAENKQSLDRLERMEKDKFAVFGNDIPGLQAKIAAETSRNRWRGTPPIGPLGMFVQLKKEFRWAKEVLGAQLKAPLGSFAITDARDRPLLLDLLRRTDK